MLGIGIVILMEIFDRRVRSPDDLANESNVPLLGVLNAGQSAELLCSAARLAPDAPCRARLRTADESPGKRPADRRI